MLENIDKIHELLYRAKCNDSLTLFLDYDGTLVEFCNDPTQVKLTHNNHRIIMALAENTKNNIVIVTGRDRDYILRAMSNLPVIIFAEHGACFFDQKKRAWVDLIEASDNRWYDVCCSKFNRLLQQYEGTWVEKKRHSLCFHYRRSSFNHTMATTLIRDLNEDTRLKQISFIDANNHIDCRPKSVSKSHAVHYFFKNNHADFSIAIGDDITDIDMFNAVKSHGGYSIAVGHRIISSDYRLKKVVDVIDFLGALS